MKSLILTFAWMLWAIALVVLAFKIEPMRAVLFRILPSRFIAWMFTVAFILRNAPHRFREITRGRKRQVGVFNRSITVESELMGWIHKLLPDGTYLTMPLGVLGRRVVTDVGVGFIVDAFQNLVELEAMNAHAIGTGSTAEAAADTALETEVQTRLSGTQSEPAANQYRTSATFTLDATRTLREHGLFNSTTAAGSKLFDRTVFAAVTLDNGDQFTTQYTLTLPSGS